MSSKEQGQRAPKNEEQAAQTDMAAELARMQRERAELEQVVARAQERHARLNEELRAAHADIDRLHAEIAKLREATPAAPGKLPRPRDGHVWCYTRYQYTVEEHVGGRWTPRIVPRGEAVEVTEAELKLDRMRRFPHLETAEEHDRRVAQSQARAAAPAAEQIAHLNALFEQAEQMQKVREQRRQATLQDVMDAHRIAAQLPE